MSAPGCGRRFALARNRAFALLWSGESVSELGSSMSLFLLPVLALAVTGSDGLAALVGTCFMGAAVLTRLPAGVLVDRSDRRRLLIAASLAGVLLYATLSGLALAGSPPYPVVLVVAVGTGLIASVSGSAESAYLRDLVRVEDLPAAFGVNQARASAAQLAGPPVGGLLYALAPWLPFLVDTATYATAASTATAIRSPVPATEARDAESILRREFADGLRAFARSRLLIRVACSNAVSNFAGAALYVLVTLKLLGAGVAVAQVGVVFTIGAVAGILGSLTASRLIAHLPTGRLILLARLVSAASLIPIALTDSPLLVGCAVAAGQFLVPAGNAATMSYLSTVMDRRVLGRTQTAYSFTCSALMPFGPALAGLLLSAWGGEPTVWTFCAITAAALVPLAQSGELRSLGRPPSWQAAQTPVPTSEEG